MKHPIRIFPISPDCTAGEHEDCEGENCFCYCHDDNEETFPTELVCCGCEAHLLDGESHDLECPYA